MFPIFAAARLAGVAALIAEGGLLVQADPASDGAQQVTDALGWLNYGVLGLLFYLFVTRRIRTAGDVADADARTTAMEQRALAAEDRERLLQESIRSDVIPAMTRITDRLMGAAQ